MEGNPAIKHDATIEDLMRFAKYIQRLRDQDISDFNNLSAVFMSGRKVGKIPSSSADIAATDKLGDFNYDDSYMYLVVDNTGAEWRRITLGSW